MDYKVMTNKWEKKAPPQTHKCTLQCGMNQNEEKKPAKKIIQKIKPVVARHRKEENFKKTLLGIRRY